ncbi:MAG: DUF3450 family protein [Planctomycetota bacterium]|nr:DUF3450 family protein [Planctomycetota bacterium]
MHYWWSLCVMMLIASSVYGQESTPEKESDAKSRIARQIREVVEHSEAARKQRQLDRENHLERVRLLERQITRLKADQVSLDAAVQQQEREIEQLTRQSESDRAAVRAARAWIADVVAIVRPLASRFTQRIEHGVGPHQQRRMAAMQTVVGLLRDDAAEQTVEGVRRFFEVIGEEWLSARSVTLANEPVVLAEGREARHSWIVGFGFVSQLFASEDGRVVGWRQHGDASQWKTELDHENRRRVANVVDIVREKQPPTLVPVPLELPVRDHGE